MLLLRYNHNHGTYLVSAPLSLKGSNVNLYKLSLKMRNITTKSKFKKNLLRLIKHLFKF